MFRCGGGEEGAGGFLNAVENLLGGTQRDVVPGVLMDVGDTVDGAFDTLHGEGTDEWRKK